MTQTRPEVAFNCRFTVPVEQQLVYSICYNTMLKPVSLTCGQSGCHECITELVKKAKAPKYPVCRKGFQAALMGVNIALDHVTSSLAVECLSAGCGWKGGYGNAAEHFPNCAKLPIPCHNIGCQIKITRHEMPSHALLCTKRKVSCPQCRKYVSWEMYEEHRAGRCDNALIPCPLNCGRVFPRTNITLHLSDCQEKATQCKVLGCHRIVKKKDMTSHLMEAAKSHHVLQSSEIRRLRKIIHNKARRLN
ncbi:TNF receptor-associated factor 5-like [Stylophora pistillata]|uniref:TNF receptor-associated factor 5-like n=1 Tax=Stylophora pistillata TaxID=50429 RepID=UPI000C043D62|nr:TNF receptor-associated factor 5-like [Stylophora pistillata]